LVIFVSKLSDAVAILFILAKVFHVALCATWHEEDE